MHNKSERHTHVCVSVSARLIVRRKQEQDGGTRQEMHVGRACMQRATTYLVMVATLVIDVELLA